MTLPGLIRWSGNLLRRLDWAGLLPVAALAVVVLLLWLPGGFRMTGLMEEWALGRLGAAGLRTTLMYTTGIAGSQYALRPLHAVPWAVSAWIPPNVIVGQNVLQSLMFFGKAAALYGLLVELLPGRRALAFFTAALFIIFPSEEGLYGLRDLAIHVSAFLILLSFYLLLIYSRAGQWPILAASLVSLTVGLLTYEVSFPLVIAASFALVFYKRLKRQSPIPALMYGAVSAALFVRYLIILTGQTSSYQVQLADAGLAGGASQTLLATINSLVSALLLNAYGAWPAAVRSGIDHPEYMPMALALALICFLVGVFLGVGKSGLPGSIRRLPLAPFGAAPVVFILGFALYLPTPLRNETERVFILASAGSALFVVGLCGLLSRALPWPKAQPAVLAALASALIGLGAIKALAQHEHYIEYSRIEQRLLAGILEIAPRVVPHACIILLDPPQDYHLFAGGAHVGDALGYLYDDRITAGRSCPSRSGPECKLNFKTFSTAQPDLWFSSCLPDRWVLLEYAPSYSGGSDIHLLDRVPAWLPATEKTDYNPRRLILAGGPPQALLDSVFMQWPPASLTDQPLDTLRIEFDQPAFGTAWRGPERDWLGLTWSWTTAPEATIRLGKLADHSYDVRVRVLWEAAPHILESLHLAVNRQALDTRLIPDPQAGVTAEASIPRQVIVQGQPNILSLIVDRVAPAGGVDPNQLGIAVDWLTLAPEPR